MESITRRSLAASIAAAVAAVPTLALTRVSDKPASDSSMVDRVRTFARQLVTGPSDPMMMWGARLEQWRIGNELLALVDGNTVKISAIPAAFMDHAHRVQYHTEHLERAMRDLYGCETKVLAFEESEGGRPAVMVVALT